MVVPAPLPPPHFFRSIDGDGDQPANMGVPQPQIFGRDTQLANNDLEAQEDFVGDEQQLAEEGYTIGIPVGIRYK